MSQICSMFLQFPQIEVTKFISNMRRCFSILNEIKMGFTEIGKIVQSQPLLLGSIALKSTNTLLLNLKIGKKELSRYIQENPQEMKNWVFGRTLGPLQLEENLTSKKFLLDIGFVENPNKITEAVNQFQGNGLQERFDCIIEAGLDHDEVCKMIKRYPLILCQSKKLIEMKIDLLFGGLPKISCGIKRIKHRVFMYNWLKDQGTIDPELVMIHLRKLNNASILKWVSSNIAQNHLRPSRTPLQPIGYFLSSYTIELYNTKTSFKTEKPEMLDITSTSTGRNGGGTSRVILKEAQAALLEYLHCTRGFQFMDAENMSKNSPQFLNKLLRSIDGKLDKDIGGLLSRYLRYHPINEFEPFFESLGLKPSEYIPHLPCNLMFLADDGLLLHNYTVLSSYGVARIKIGKIFKEAREVFRYDFEVLLSKLQAYEELGLSQFALVKFIVCSPCILVGDVNVPFVKLLEKLKCLGFKTHWIERNLSEDNSYSWNRILEVLRLFNEMGCSNKQLVELLGQHPDILFESSGERTLSLIGFLLKFGSTRSQICSMFLQFPQIQIVQFVLNLRKCVLVLNEIEMEVAEIQKIVCSHPLLLGSCALKSTNSLLSYLKIGKKRLSRYIQENPEALKKWVLGRRVEPLPDSEEDSKGKRVKFLLDVGFVENSNKMEVALKLFRGKGGELQDRFNCLVNAGLNRQDVCDMIKVSPQILNQQRDVLQMKIDVLVNHLGYPVSSLVNFPSYLSYTTQRVKLRVFMYNWLRGQGTISPTLALSTVIAMAEKQFLSQYVNHHPCGPQVWHELKSKLYYV
ncbi:hypothetical protein ACLB2K_063438 [Fragaria x ananassa]